MCGIAGYGLSDPALRAEESALRAMAATLVHRGPDSGVHVAFTAENREIVDAFHAAALEAGGTDNGGPGLREIYHPDYYGAFVLDPDGNNVEAVCHLP